jgi:SMC interacting uncharacterized protein involved in chromosome segregation
MTNNKQQTEINAVEYLGKVNQFAKENNTDKPKQQTAIEWLEQEMLKPNLSMKEILEQAKEIEKERIETAYNKGTVHGIDYPESTLPITGEQYYNETYGGGEQ